jgi:hypothetical protein
MIPKKNLAESILARAELFRSGLMFGGVPSLSGPDLQLPAPPDLGGQAAPAPGMQQQPAPPADPSVTNELVAGSVDNKTPLQTMLTP